MQFLDDCVLAYLLVGPLVYPFVFFRLHDLCMYLYVLVLFYLGQLSHFPSCFGTCVINLNDLSFEFLLPPHYCRLGAGSVPFRAIVYKKQCETRGSSTTE